MQQAMIEIMNQFGYMGIIFLIAVENIFPPIPSEVILTFGGFMTTYTQLTPWGVIISATLGSLIGAVVLYYAGRLLSSDKMDRIINGKVGKMLHLKKEEIDYTISWFAKKGRFSVFFCRCVPILRSLISIPAGAAGMNMTSFLVMTITGSLIWNIVLVYLGVAAGASWTLITKGMSTYANLIRIVLVLLISTLIMYVYMRKRSKKQKRS